MTVVNMSAAYCEWDFYIVLQRHDPYEPLQVLQRHSSIPPHRSSRLPADWLQGHRMLLL